MRPSADVTERVKVSQDNVQE